MKLIKDFCEIGERDVSLLGGKGTALTEMTQAHFPVPPGFILTTEAYQHFLVETNLHIAIDSILQNIDYQNNNNIETAAAKIQAMIVCEEIPSETKDAICSYFSTLDSPYVAVRSSATMEDNFQATWAGQLETYLNTTRENLLYNIKRCWASLFTPRAIFYRFKKHLHKEAISMAVIVQKMLRSQVSGIAFSMNPITNNRDHIRIESIFGLGEAIASGYITPDSYLVNKTDWSIIKREIFTQEKAIVQSQSGGNEWYQLHREKGQSQKLSDNEIIALSKIITKIEKHYSFPIDIEWAKEDDDFYILQSRPIIICSNRKTNKIKTIKGLFSYGTYSSNLLTNDSFYNRPQTFTGIPVSLGITKGKVRLILYKDAIDELQAGEILVTAISTPELISAMHKASAIITDEGGQQCHLAIFLSREMHKPCIIGTKTATKFLQTGDFVEVNGDKGTISILEHPTSQSSNNLKDLRLFDL